MWPPCVTTIVLSWEWVVDESDNSGGHGGGSRCETAPRFGINKVAQRSDLGKRKEPELWKYFWTRCIQTAATIIVCFSSAVSLRAISSTTSVIPTGTRRKTPWTRSTPQECKQQGKGYWKCCPRSKNAANNERCQLGKLQRKSVNVGVVA